MNIRAIGLIKHFVMGVISRNTCREGCAWDLSFSEILRRV